MVEFDEIIKSPGYSPCTNRLHDEIIAKEIISSGEWHLVCANLSYDEKGVYIEAIKNDHSVRCVVSVDYAIAVGLNPNRFDYKFVGKKPTKSPSIYSCESIIDDERVY